MEKWRRDRANGRSRPRLGLGAAGAAARALIYLFLLSPSPSFRLLHVSLGKARVVMRPHKDPIVSRSGTQAHLEVKVEDAAAAHGHLSSPFDFGVSWQQSSDFAAMVGHKAHPVSVQCPGFECTSSATSIVIPKYVVVHDDTIYPTGVRSKKSGLGRASRCLFLSREA